MLIEFDRGTVLDVFPSRQWNFGYSLGGAPSLQIVEKSIQYYGDEDGVKRAIDIRHDDLTEWFPRQILAIAARNKME